MKTSAAVTSLPRSGIRAIYELALSVPDSIHLEVGEPNFPTPAHVVEAAARAAADGFTKYTPNAGIAPLREALADKVATRNGIGATPEQVVVTPGAVAGIYSTLAALVDPGDEVLLADPSWPNYALMMRLLGIRAVHFRVRSHSGLVPTAADIEPHISDRTRAIILNSPGNPTGSIIREPALVEILELARRHDLWILSDEVYDEIWFDTPPIAMAPLDDDGRVVTFYSFSKTYAMTGWRVGYLVAPPAVAADVIKAQEPITSCVNAPAQMGAIAAVTGPQDCVGEMRASYKERRDAVVELFERRGIAHVRPTGAFYVMVDVAASGIMGLDFARRLVVEKGVAVVPGDTFGPDSGRFVRVSLATAPDLLLEGCNRLADAVAEWGS
jgi:aspartate/methionine/tyrosine aminotransferase